MWEQVKSPCIGGGTGGVPDTSSIKYTVEKVKVNGKDFNLFTQYITYKNTFSKNKDNEGLSYYESKFWLNQDGLILRQEYQYGLIEFKRIDRTTIDIYEYDPKIKIEAPIK